MTARVAPSSALTVLVSQEYDAHAHHSADSTSMPLASPAHVGSCAISAVTCVIAKTNTRSKNSSSGVTFCSVSTWWSASATAVIRIDDLKAARREPIAGTVSCARSLRRCVFAILLAGVAAYALAPSQALLTGVEAGALALLAWRAVTDPEGRVAWLAITVAMALWLAGDATRGAPADTLYFGSYLLGYPGLVGIVVASMPRPWRAWLVIDGVQIGLALGAYLAMIVHHSIGSAVPAWTLGGDVLLLTTVTLVFSLCGWRPGL